MLDKLSVLGDVLLIWIILRQGPIALAVGAGGGLSFPFSVSLSGRWPDID